MGKKKKAAKKEKKKLKKALKKMQLSKSSVQASTKLKSKCCSKYQKGEHKRCKRCPCFDLMKKVA